VKMKTVKILTCMAVGVVVVWAADVGGFGFWPASELSGLDKSLATKVDPKLKVATEQLGNYGNHSLVVVHREANGEAEIHEKQVDVLIGQSGEARLITGGRVIGGRNTGPGEIRGTSIEGGREMKLAPGDVAHIPAGTPHQAMVAPGGRVTYLIVKVDAR